MAILGDVGKIGLGLLLGFLLCLPAFSEDLRFDIGKFAVDGNTLLTRDEIRQTLSPYEGKHKSFADVQRAIDALQKVYLEYGYGAVEVLLPEQELQNGIVHLKVVEGRIAAVKVEGNSAYSAENIRRSIPSLVTGTTPRARDIAANLRLANLNPGKQEEVVLKEGGNEADIDAVIKVREKPVSQFALSLDNTGTRDTGVDRVGFSYRNADLFGLDHVLTMSYMTSLQRPSSVTIFGAGYRIPLYGRSSYVDLTAGYSSVNSGVVQNLFNVSGSGTILGARYIHLLSGNSENFGQSIGFGLDYRALSNNVTTVNGGQSLIPNVTIHPLELTYDGNLKMERGTADVHLSVSQNINSSDSSIKLSRPNGKAAYRIFRYAMNYWHAWQNDFQIHLAWQGQKTSDALVSSEQFGAGGAYSVRGFSEREIADDNGYATSIELYFPEKRHVRPLVFADQAKVWRNFPLAGESPSQNIGSIGVGFRAVFIKNLNIRFDWGRVVSSSLVNGHKPGNYALHAGLVYMF